VVERGPEKAGVGGSIPSLATKFSTTYKPKRSRSRSNRAVESVNSHSSSVGRSRKVFVNVGTRRLANGLSLATPQVIGDIRKRIQAPCAKNGLPNRGAVVDARSPPMLGILSLPKSFDSGGIIKNFRNAPHLDRARSLALNTFSAYQRKRGLFRQFRAWLSGAILTVYRQIVRTASKKQDRTSGRDHERTFQAHV
jgi:hypothetical protein